MDSAARPTTLGALVAGLPDVTYEGCGPDTAVAGLVMDSRAVRPGVAFVAVRGGTVDGHAFIDGARVAGATVAFIDGDGHADPPSVRLSDATAALPTLAANLFDRPAESLTLAGVTGTNGKTTTAHLVAAVLARAGHRHVRLGTTGNWLVDHEDRSGFTTPFPLELQGLLADSLAGGASHGVMEVSSHALQQGRAGGVSFAAVALTSFSQDHLDFHPDMDAYLAVKCRLASDHLRRDGLAVAAVDDQPAASAFLRAAHQAGGRAWRASRGDDTMAELRARAVSMDANGIQMTAETPMGSISLASPLVGAFNVDNLLVAAGLCLGLDLSPDDIAAGLSTARGAPGRLERVEGPGAGPRVFVDYAHTPDAVRNVLATLRPLTAGRLVVLLGCGGDRDRAKRPLMGEVAVRGADRFFATSDNPRTEDPGAIVDEMLAGVAPGEQARVVREVDRASAIRQAIAEAGPGDTVVLAGKGHEDYQVLGTDTIHFDDREHAAAALRELA